MKERKCPYCGESFIPKHLNRKYCRYECYNENKKDRNRKLYADMQMYAPALRNDQILGKIYSEGFEVVSLQRIESLGFNRQYFMRQINSGNKTINVTGRYGYSSYSDTKLFIHKIKS